MVEYKPWILKTSVELDMWTRWPLVMSAWGFDCWCGTVHSFLNHFSVFQLCSSISAFPEEKGGISMTRWQIFQIRIFWYILRETFPGIDCLKNIFTNIILNLFDVKRQDIMICIFILTLHAVLKTQSTYYLHIHNTSLQDISIHVKVLYKTV